jgi:hypothetical protein
MAHSGRLTHGTGWGRPNCHIKFCRSGTSVSSKIGHDTGMGTCTSIRSGVGGRPLYFRVNPKITKIA